jgi:F-type H+-transporting ATPase subunit b
MMYQHLEVTMFVTSAFAASSEAAAQDAHAAGTQVPAEAAGHEGAFPPFNPQYFGSQILWLAITFGIFYLIISRAVAPRIGAILEDRQDRIARDLDEASRMKAESDAAVAAFEKELADARSKAGSIAAEAAAVVKADAEKERAAVEASLSEKLAAAEKQISAMKSAALAEVGGIAEEAVSEIVRQVVGVELTSAEAATAVKSAAGN